MGAAVRPPQENTVAVKVNWVPPHDNGAPIKGYRVERAKAFRKNNRAPIAEANWTQVRALKHDERDITDVPPTNHRLYWYRIVCHNKVGISDPGVASKIDLTDEATELHPNLRPLSLVEAPAPAPSLLEAPSTLLEASVASRPSKLLAVEAVASLLEAPEAVAPPAPAPEAPDIIPSPRPLPKLKRPKKRWSHGRRARRRRLLHAPQDGEAARRGRRLRVRVEGSGSDFPPGQVARPRKPSRCRRLRRLARLISAGRRRPKPRRR